MEIDYSKVCSYCKEKKPLYEFFRNRETYDGLCYKCKSCIKKTKGLSELQKISKNTLSPTVSDWERKKRKKKP